jgi:hypothetical protein
LWRWVRENESISSDTNLIHASSLKLHCDLLIDLLDLPTQQVTLLSSLRRREIEGKEKG